MMGKKVVMWVALAGVIGLLVLGAVNRTVAKLETGTGSGSGRGQVQHQDEEHLESTVDSQQMQVEESDAGQQLEQESSGGSLESDAATGGGQGRGGGNGEGRGQNQGKNKGSGQGDRFEGQEQREWMTLTGMVTAADQDTLVVTTVEGQAVHVANRPWWLAQSEGFNTSIGHTLTLTGFYEAGDGEFKAAQIEDTDNGQSVSLRDENGRPLWAGQGQGRGNE